MNHTAPTTRIMKTRKALFLAAAGVLAGLPAGVLHAAPQPAALVNPTGGARAASASRGEGLDALGDTALMTELSSRGLNSLLDHYFELKGIPATERQTIRTLAAAADLKNPNIKLTYGERLRRVKDTADDIDAVIATYKKPEDALMMANTLTENGVKRDVNTLEYWGENPLTQMRLKPIATSVVKLLDHAAKTAQAQADEMAGKLKGGNDPNGARWEALDNMSHGAAYSMNMSVYFAALATDAKDPARKTMADSAIKALTEFDNDGSGVQPRVKNMIAKLQMVSGDFKSAKKSFAAIIDPKGGILPAPNPIEQYEAHYFNAVSDVLAKDLPSAQADLAALETWEAESLPKLLADYKLPDGKGIGKSDIDETLKGVAAANPMLKYRVLLLESDQAKSPADKKKAEDSAVAVLEKLEKDRPDLAQIINEQLVNRLPNDKPVATMNALLLRSLMDKGLIEYHKGATETPDIKVMDRAVAAAKEVVTRKDRTGISPQSVDDAQILIPTLLDRQGKKVEAANGYLDYAAGFFKTNPKLASQAVDRAGTLVLVDLKKEQPSPTGFSELYARFLPVAINSPYNHKELAYLYAEHLRAQKQMKEALAFYRAVPKENPSYPNAQYKQMLVLGDLLDAKLTPAEHKQYVSELTKIAEEIKQGGASAKGEWERGKAVKATLVLADLARIEQKDPKRTLAVLEGFDQMVAGLPDEKEMLRGSQIARVNAYMGLGQSSEATQELRKLLEKTQGDDGIGLVRMLLDQLDKEYARADLVQGRNTATKEEHDAAVASMRQTAKDEATLTGYLVDWSNPKTQKDPKVSQYFYSYAVYDARTQRQAGTLVEDMSERTKLLTQALDRYKKLQSKDMHDLYVNQPTIKQKIADGKLDPKDGDSSVEAGLALTEFDLQDFKGARDLLDSLLMQKKLGTPTMEVVENGETKVKDNDLYWEATYKLLKSSIELDKGDPKLLAVDTKGLKNILIRGGIPERWQDEFEGLRADWAKDFHPAGATATSQPAAPEKPAASAK
jgi:tetratricopeptide (TPR) repeat protein